MKIKSLPGNFDALNIYELYELLQNFDGRKKKEIDQIYRRIYELIQIEINNTGGQILRNIEEDEAIVYKNDKGEDLVDVDNDIIVRNRRVKMIVNCYIEGLDSKNSGLQDVIYQRHPKQKEYNVELDLDNNGNFNMQELIDQVFEQNDKFQYIDDSSLGYNFYIQGKPKKIDGNLIGRDVPRNLRTLNIKEEHENDFKIYAHEPFRYVIMKNIKQFNDDKICFAQTLEYLKIQCNQEEMTKYQLYNIIKTHRDDIYIIGEELRPYNTKLFKHQLLCISNHVYLSRAHKPLLSTNMELCKKITAMDTFTICDDLQELYDKCIQEKEVPYFVSDKLLLDENDKLYITSGQKKIFDLCGEFYGKKYISFTFLPLFKDFLKTDKQIIGYTYRALNIRMDNKKAKVVQHIDMISAYPSSFFELDDIYSVEHIIFVMQPINQESVFEFSKYYRVQLYSDNVLMNNILHVTNTISGQTFQLFKTIAKQLKTTFEGTLEYIYEIKQINADHKQILEKMDSYKGEDKKLLKNSVFGVFAKRTPEETRQQILQIDEKRGVDTQLLNVFNKQLNYSGESNNQFLHAQMMNSYVYRLLKDYIYDLDKIIAIKTDSLYFSEEQPFDEKVFRKEKDLSIDGIVTNKFFDPIENKTHTIIQAQAGQGKSRFIHQTANKEKDLIIVVSNDNYQKYVDDGFKNVYTYQFLDFVQLYEFIEYFENIYVDEWCLVENEVILNLMQIRKHLILVGDINQNINRNSKRIQYENIIKYFGSVDLDTKGQATRNKIDINTMKNKQDIIDQMEDYPNVHIIYRVQDARHYFDCEDVMILAKTNRAKFQINMLYQNSDIKNKKIQQTRKTLTYQTPQHFTKQHPTEKHVYLNDNDEGVNTYYGICETIYKAQGLEAKKVVVFLSGNETFEDLYVAFTRIKD